jgi:hypothetical protein
MWRKKMNKRENITNMNSCLNKAHEDEPVFVLRANDPLAAHIVESWAEYYKATHEGAGTYTLARKAKYTEAWHVADSMRTWREKAVAEAKASPTLPAEALNAIREKVDLQGDKLVLRQGFWVTLRESLGLEENETRDMFS